MLVIGMQKVECIIKELDNDQAIIEMVDSNKKREHILPSEKVKDLCTNKEQSITITSTTNLSDEEIKKMRKGEADIEED